MTSEMDFAAVLEQLRKQQEFTEMQRQDIEQQRLEFKNVMDQLVQERRENERLREGSLVDNVSRSDFNKVLEELTRYREEARNDAREQLAQAHRRENANREEAREQRQEMASLYKLMLNQQGQQNPHPSPNSNLNSSSNQSSVQFDQSHMMTELLDKQHQEHQKEMFSLHRLLKNLQQGAVANPGQVVPVENLPSLIPPQEATTTTINTPTTPIPTNNSSSVVHPEPSPAPAPAPQPTTTTTNSQTNQIQQTKDEWQSVAELLYSKRSNNHLNNYEHVTEILAANPSLFEPLLERCPNIGLIIAHLLKLRFGLTVQKVSWTSSISDWNGEDCRRVGCSVAAFLRNFQTGEAALEAWKLNYVQVSEYEK